MLPHGFFSTDNDRQFRAQYIALRGNLKVKLL